VFPSEGGGVCVPLVVAGVSARLCTCDYRLWFSPVVFVCLSGFCSAVRVDRYPCSCIEGGASGGVALCVCDAVGSGICVCV